MKMKRRDSSTTFLKFDKVNGRSYKTVRVKPCVGPSPSINLYDAMPKPANPVRLDNISMDDNLNNLDFYNESHLEEGIDSDGLNASEAGVMRGYTAI